MEDAILKLMENTDSRINSIKEGSLEYFGVVKLIEIIGEAVYKLTNEFKVTHPQTPWRQIERMRHVLVHGYYTVSYDFIKEVIEYDMPILKSQIQDYLKELKMKNE